MNKIHYVVILFLLGSLGSFLISVCNVRFASNLSNITRSSPIANCRTIQHTMGEACVTAPQHLVTLSLPALANALILGVQLVGSTNQNQKEYIFPKYLEGKTEIESLGGNAQPSIEKILLLKPDLILGWNRNNRGIYPLLSKIAPTLLYDWQGTGTWRDHFNFMAKVVGKEEAAQKAWDNYYRRIQDLKNALGIRYRSKKISFVYFCCGGFGSQAKNSFAGSILTDVGLQRPEA